MRILLVSQMYPGPDAPDLGVFVASLERELAARGHELERAVVDRRGGRVAAPRARARRGLAPRGGSAPDVVYAHFLVPAGLLGALAGRAPARRHRPRPGRRERRARSRCAGRRAGRSAGPRAVIAVSAGSATGSSRRCRRRAAKTDGDRLRRRPRALRAARCRGDARAAVGWEPDGHGASSASARCTERKNVLRLARAFARRGEGSLAFVGDGPLRGALEGRAGVRARRARPARRRCRLWLAAADVVCQPSLVEPFGLATLEAMASGRSVVATTVGGPPEFVAARGRRARRPAGRRLRCAPALDGAAALPRPNLDARRAAEAHDVRVQAARVEALLARAAAAAS